MRCLAWIALSLAVIMAIPGVEPRFVFAHVLGYVCERKVVKEHVPDGFRGGVYEVIGVNVLLADWVEIRYRPAVGASRDLLFISGSRDNFTEEIKLLPMPGGLTVEIDRAPPVSLFITSQELGDLGGAEGPLMIFNGQREGRQRARRQRLRPAWTWSELTDSAYCLVVALILFIAPWWKRKVCDRMTADARFSVRAH